MRRLIGWWRWNRLAMAAALYGYLAYINMRQVDPDFGWHYRLGEYIVAHGIPYQDVLSYTAAGQPWVDHEWLNNVVLYEVGHRLGYWWLALGWTGLWLVALLIAVRRLNWPVVGLVLAALMPYTGVRSIAWTVMGLAGMLFVLERPSRWRWAPVIMLLWANLHGGFAVGLVVLALQLVFERSWRLAAWGLASVAATLVNPYGFGLYGELWQQMTDRGLGHYIVEWMPLELGWHVGPFVVVAAVILVMQRRWTFDWLRSAGLLAAALWSNRHVPLLVVSSLAMVEEAVRQGLVALSRWRWATAVAVTAGIVYPLWLFWAPSDADSGMKLERPSRALINLKNRPCAGHVFNDYNYGGLIIWALPGVPVYIDGRMPSWRGPQGRYLDRYIEVLKGGSALQADFARYDVQCALISSGDTKVSAALARTAGWRLVIAAQDAQLWRRD